MSKQNPDNSTQAKNINRRGFIRYSAAAGAGLLLSPALSRAAIQQTQPINTAIIGVGRQGKILLDLLIKIPNVKMKEVCAIWKYSQLIGERRCKSYNHIVTVYEDYKEMLAKEKELEAVVIATPDFVHHEMTNACLRADLHVYCEKEMSNDIEKARSMVQTAKQTGKLLQIGHQRRSNPYYIHAHRLMHKDRVFGDINSINGQWNQQKQIRPFPPRLESNYHITPALLKKWGFTSMSDFYYWRWFNKFAGGPMADLGSHQVDIFNWFLEAPPASVYAIGGLGYALTEAKANNVGFTPECLDHTLALYEWKTKQGTVRGYYQVNLTTSYNGFYEVFMGKKGSMVISEILSKHAMFKERSAATLEWEDEAEKLEIGGEQAMLFDPLKSRKAKGKMDKEGLKIEQDLDKPAHQPHLENFFAAIRDGVPLNCPAEVGFETCVSVLKTNESAVTGKKITFNSQDFVA